MHENHNLILLLWTGSNGLVAVAYLVGLLNITMYNEFKILGAWSIAYTIYSILGVLDFLMHIVTHRNWLRTYLYFAPSAVTVILYEIAHYSLEWSKPYRFIKEFMEREISHDTIPPTLFQQALTNEPPRIFTDTFIMILILTPLLVVLIVYHILPSITVEADAKQAKD